MSVEALDFQLKRNFGSSNRLLVYYDFLPSSIFCPLSGSVYQSYLKNQYPSSISGLYDGKIIGATGISSGSAANLATGANRFLASGTGYFQKNSIEISGASSLELKNCSYLFCVDSELHNDGVFLGSFEKIEEVVNSETIKYSKGFNFGQNSRGKTFFQSLGENGEYCFVNQEDELSKKNILGLSFGNGEITVSRFDYLNEQVYSKSFQFDSSKIKNCESLYLGSSPSYWRGSEGENLFSGNMQGFALLSGKISSATLYEIGKGFISDYVFETGSVSSTGILSGYLTEIIYKTGVTGVSYEITGYEQIRSGTNTFNTGYYYTGMQTVVEGDKAPVSYGEYTETEGFLAPEYINTYLPDGNSGESTKGLQDGFYSISGYTSSGEEIFVTINSPLYGTTYLTGTLSDISGVINTPVYITGYITGADTSGTALQGNFEDFQKNYIYYLGTRS